MGNHWENVMVGIEKIVGFQTMNFERTLVALFHILPLVLGGWGCRKRKKI